MKFTPERTLYDDGFQVAFGSWDEDDKKHIAMRWEGEEGQVGFPNTYGKPTWLLIHEDLALPFATALLTVPESDKDAVLAALRDLVPQHS